MRRYYLLWSITVFGLIGTIYGGYLLIYHFNHGNGLSVLALILLILGLIALIFAIAVLVSRYIARKRKVDEPVAPIVDDGVEDDTTKDEDIQPLKDEAEPVTEEEIEPIEEEVEQEPAQIEDDEAEIEEDDYEPSYQSTYQPSSSYSYSTVYVKQVGYGPLLRIEGNRIIDMRTNTYYRIENNMVNQEGYGPVFEIRGNQIKDAFGGYLYEISGSNINKVFGGFYASISGNYITLYDSSMKFEMTDSLSKRQILVVASLLFGRY